jgi:CubicO group peptidase (beta-lactamase class C family)
VKARRCQLKIKICLVASVGVLAGCSSVPATGGATRSITASVSREGRVRPAVDALLAADNTGLFRNLRALLVSAGGDLLVEEYRGISRTDRTNIQSAGKSILSSLIGIAIGEGRIKGTDQALGDLLPAYAPVMSDATRRITLKQLLTMTADLPDDDAFYSGVLDQADWVRFILSHDPGAAPGGFSYASAGSHLLAAILQQATGMPALDYARQRLFDPLGIPTTPSTTIVASRTSGSAYDRATDFVWPVDPRGVYVGGGGEKLAAQDLLRLGRLWLDRGRWEGRQIVPSGWLDQATAAQVRTPLGLGYGYHFWVTTADGHHAFAALGFGGQVVEVVPDLALVVVVQSRSPSDPTAPADPGAAQEQAYLSLVDHVIAPALG